LGLWVGGWVGGWLCTGGGGEWWFPCVCARGCTVQGYGGSGIGRRGRGCGCRGQVNWATVQKVATFWTANMACSPDENSLLYPSFTGSFCAEMVYLVVVVMLAVLVMLVVLVVVVHMVMVVVSRGLIYERRS